MRLITYILTACIMTVGFVMTGQLIKDGLIQIRSADRYVTVKGLAERDVKANLAVWPIQFKVADNDLKIAEAELNRQSAIIQNFLIENGVTADEISVQSLIVNDAYAQQYQRNQVAARYAIDKTILVRTENVDNVVKAAEKIGDLVREGVLIGYGAIPQYSFTELNAIKPEMIAQATTNAREAAEQFANDSGAKVGDIRSASQGYFSILARDDVGGQSSDNALYKKVRVVSTVEYYLND